MRPEPAAGQRGEHLVVLQFVLFFTFVLVPVWSPWVTPAVLAGTGPLRWAVLTLAGVSALLLAGLGVLRLRPYLTPLPYPVAHNRLVQTGIYARVRHPLYASQLYAALGWTVFQLSLSHLLVLALGFVFFDYKATREERWLTARHPEYADYARRVKKFVPRVY